MHFATSEGEEVYFDKNGDPAAKYEVINWKMSKDHQHEFATVGLYDSSLPVHERLNVNMTLITWAQDKKTVCTGNKRAMG